MKKGIFRIEITIKTPRITITEWFDRGDYQNNEDWIKAAKKWIREDEE